MTVLIRKPTGDDQSFVAATWVDSLMFGDVSRRRGEANDLVDRLLDDRTVRLAIACDATDQRTIHGWLCYSPGSTIRLVHYVYVRVKKRKDGIARQLVEFAWPGSTEPLGYTLRGPDAKELLKKHRAIHVNVHDYLGEQRA